MGAVTEIAWTDATFNPWWGCQRVSPGCQFCYAETFAKRTGNDVWGKESPRRFFGDKHWNEPLRWDRRAAEDGVRRRVFCASMADVFEDRRDLDPPRERLWDLIESTPNLDWQLLTKRPQNVVRLARWGTREWPANVWLGTTVEDQQRAEERIPHLKRIPARVRFLSCEPLLGPVYIRPWLPLGGIHWVIVGGESGPKHRPMNLDYARALREQCAFGHVPFFFKQVGGRTPKAGGSLLDGRAHREFPEAPS
jgi:protein gp37